MQLITILTKLTHDEFIALFKGSYSRIRVLSSQYIDNNVLREYLNNLDKDFNYIVQIQDNNDEEKAWIEIAQFDTKSEAIQYAIDREGGEVILLRVIEKDLNSSNRFVIYQTSITRIIME